MTTTGCGGSIVVTGTGLIAGTEAAPICPLTRPLLAPKPILIALLGAAGIAFVLFWIRPARGAAGRRWPTARQLGIGALTDFFDTLGIGSFATTTSLYKLAGVVADENIPGTLNVGHMIPTFAEAFIFILVIGRRRDDDADSP